MFSTQGFLSHWVLIIFTLAFDSRSLIPTDKTVYSAEVKYLRVPTASAAIGVCKVFRMQRNNFICAICNGYRGPISP